MEGVEGKLAWGGGPGGEDGRNEGMKEGDKNTEKTASGNRWMEEEM